MSKTDLLFFLPFLCFLHPIKEVMTDTQDFWTKKYRQNIGKMIGLCHRYVMDPALAEDLAHEAFLLAIEKSGSFKGIGSFDRWMMRITTNTVLQHLRKKQYLVPMDDLSTADLEAAPVDEEELERYDFTQSEILDAIAALPVVQRTVFNLFVFEKYSHREIAETLSMAERTSKRHLALARQQLQRLLTCKKHKQIKLMIPVFLIFKRCHAVDDICRRTLRDYAVEPAVPYEMESVPWGSVPKIPVLLAAKGLFLALAVGTVICLMAGYAFTRLLPHAAGLSPAGPSAPAAAAACAPADTATFGDGTTEPNDILMRKNSDRPSGGKFHSVASVPDTAEITEPQYVYIRDTVYKTVVKTVHDTVYVPISMP